MLHGGRQFTAYEKTFTGYHNNFSKSINRAVALS